MSESEQQADGRIIYFLTIQIVEEVYVQPLGFTRMFYKFAFAESEAIASALAQRYCQAHKLTPRSITMSRSVQQALDLYCYPEQILRDRPLARLWRGEVVVERSDIPKLLGIGATCETHLRDDVYLFVAPEPVAAQLNDEGNPDCIGLLKPWMAASARSGRQCGLATE